MLSWMQIIVAVGGIDARAKGEEVSQHLTRRRIHGSGRYIGPLPAIVLPTAG